MAEDSVSRARRLVGARFRPQGRSAAQGVDCIGLAAAAVEMPFAKLPRDYRLRGDHAGRIVEGLEGAGLARVAEPRAGDILLVQAGPQQWHLLVLTDGGFVHADAGLGRVVERPSPVPWPVMSAWRGKEDE